MHSLKASGLDGFQPLFYKQFWHIIGNEDIQKIQIFFITKVLNPTWNSTFSSVIPKNSTLIKVSHFGPSSLCNVLYKVISKILVKRLRDILNSHISPLQAAFILDNWISKNTLIE